MRTFVYNFPKVKKIFLVFLISQISGPTTLSSQSAICLDIGQPINASTGQILVNYDVIANTCTPFVRLNFILGPWNSPEDNTLHSGMTWEQAYGEIIDSLTQRGIRVYGLIGAQMVYAYLNDLLIDYPSYNIADSAQAAQWEEEYVYNFVKVVDLFKDRVRTFESFNEPNNWNNGWCAVVHPKWFAFILQEVYLNVKFFNGHSTDSLWQVKLISGPLFTWDGNDGSQYLSDTYNYGKNFWAWDWTKQQTSSYPLDGIGMHIYCAQGTSDSATVVNAMLANINAVWNIITNWEGTTAKQIWISEFGWESTAVTEQGQADNMNNGYELLLGDNRIALSTFFTVSDWPGYYWGIFYFGNFSSADRKIAYYEFLNTTNCNPVSVEDLSGDPFILHFDNSTGNYFLDGAGVFPEIKIELYNSIGQKVYTTITEREFSEKNIMVINDPDLSGTGIFFLQLTGGRKSHSFKLVF